MAELNILMVKAKMIFIGALTVSLVLGRALRIILYVSNQRTPYRSRLDRPVLLTSNFVKPIKGHATFEDWAVEFEKTYSSDAELSYRKQVWEKTLIKIEKHNAELLEGKHTYGMGLNQFSDMTPEEFKMLYLTPKFDDPKPVRQANFDFSDRLQSE